jgi:hypothetical protein
MGKGSIIAEALQSIYQDALGLDYGSIDIKLIFHDGKLVRKETTKQVSTLIVGITHD